MRIKLDVVHQELNALWIRLCNTVHHAFEGIPEVYLALEGVKIPLAALLLAEANVVGLYI